MYSRLWNKVSLGNAVILNFFLLQKFLKINKRSPMFNPESRVLHNIKIEIYKKYVANNFWLVFFQTYAFSKSFQCISISIGFLICLAAVKYMTVFTQRYVNFGMPIKLQLFKKCVCSVIIKVASCPDKVCKVLLLYLYLVISSLG